MIRKNLSNLPFLSKTRREQCVDVNNPLQTVLKLFKLYILTQIVLKSIIVLLANVLANIFS